MKIKSFLAAALIGLNVLVVSSTAVAPVFAEVVESDACDNLVEGSIAYKSNGCGGYGNTDELPTVIQNILNSVILISGTVALTFVIVGGVQYMASTGDPGKTKKAKDTILYACVGLVICALAFIIVNWTISIINSAT